MSINRSTPDARRVELIKSDTNPLHIVSHLASCSKTKFVNNKETGDKKLTVNASSPNCPGLNMGQFTV